MKRLVAFITFFLLICNFSIFSQSTSIQLYVFDTSQLDISAFLFDNNLTNQQRILQVNITPTGKKVVVEGVISWKENLNSNFVEVATFKTNSFLSRTFFNDEIGNSEILYAEKNANSNVVDRIRILGKPTGQVEIKIRVFDEKNTFLDDTYETLTFENPSQTIEITSPFSGDELNPLNFQIAWSEVQGAEYYLVKASYKIDANQSNEAALNSGTPVINNFNAGTRLTIGTSEPNVLQRELLEGSRLVIQVTAHISGVGGGSNIYSKIIPVTIQSLTNGMGGNSENNVLSEIDGFINKMIDILPNPIINDLRNSIKENSTLNFQVEDEDGNSKTLLEAADFIRQLKRDGKIISVKYLK
ncbi:hypothetical protein APF79_05065 [bacterium BRH_c32]|nr:MAG: hypothetical protein APF79_05065 [bacterium BRH_c32]